MKTRGLMFDSERSLMEPSATVLYDRSRYGNNGTFKGDGEPNWVQLPSGLWVMEFDETDDYVNLGNVANVGVGDFSVATWVYVTSNRCRLISKGNTDSTPGVATKGYVLEATAWQTFNFQVQDADEEMSAVANGVYVPGTQYFVVGTADKDGLLKLYIDAVLQNDQPDISTVGNLGNTSNLRLGNYSASNSFPLGGQLALSRIWNYVLSAGQILKMRHAERHWFGV